MLKSIRSARIARGIMAFAAVAALAGCADKMTSDTPMADGARGRPVSDPPHVPDAQMQKVLDQLASLHPKPIETLEPKDARAQPSPTDAVKQLLTMKGMPSTPDDGVKVEQRTIQGAAGMIPARVYTPPGGKAGERPLIVYYRGGGWVIATQDTYEPSCRALALMTGATVLSVEYRQAPEFPFPAAHEDSYAALQWAFANAGQLGVDPTKIAVVGESAGGNLAYAVCLMARDRGGKMPIAQVLIYPVAGTKPGSPSEMQYADVKWPLHTAMLPWFLKYYAPKPEDKTNTNLNILESGGDLTKLPPATILTAEIDPLRSGGEMLAAKLKTAGVGGGDVVYKNFDGVTHEFFGMGLVVDTAKKAEMLASDRLKAAFAMKKMM